MLVITPEDLNHLKVLNPTKSFVFFFLNTKQVNLGGNSFQYDVDVVTKVSEKCKAV
jgi:hypothetical protein